PDDPTRLTLEVFDTATSTWVPMPASGSTTVAGTFGTWQIHADSTVTFTHNGSTNYTITPLRYRVTNVYGGWDEALLKVTVSESPNTVCTAADTSSEKYWAFGPATKFDFGS